MKTCYVCEYGWIIVGTMRSTNSDYVKLADASVVRSWRNGKGIGGIAKEANKADYTADPIGDVFIRLSKVLFEIPCEW